MPDARLKGTHRAPWPGVEKAGLPLDLDRDVLVTFWLPAPPSRAVSFGDAYTFGSTSARTRRYAAPEELFERTNAPPDAFKPLHRFCESNNFEVVDTHWRSAVVRGATGRVMEALDAEVELGALQGRPFRMRIGSMHAPAELQGIVRVALGLHQWPKSALLQRAPAAAGSHPTASAIAQVCERYGIPDGDGAGETIAIIQLNASFSQSDFSTAMTAQGMHAGTPVVKRVDNAALIHKAATTKDAESSIDTQIAGAFAPGARIVIYEAPNSERGLLDALRAAIFDREHAPSIVSISFGWAELVWTPVALEIVNELFAAAALLGISIVCASGDYGAAADRFAIAPATSPLALACGATVIDGDGNESMWNRSGGGFSGNFDVPAWQTNASAVSSALSRKPGRGTPDVCAQMAFPIWMDGIPQVSAGTSAVAPFIAATIARLNQRAGMRSGFFAPLLYGSDARAAFRPITKGTTGDFSVAANWNPCSGLGAPLFGQLEKLLSSE